MLNKKIFIDGYFLYGNHGVANVLKTLCREFASGNILTIGTTKDTYIEKKNFFNSINAKVYLYKLPSIFRLIELSFICIRNKYDHYSFHYFTPLVILNTHKVHVWIYDLLYYDFKNDYSFIYRFTRKLINKLFLSKKLKIITISEYSKKRILYYFRNFNVDVVKLGLSSEFISEHQNLIKKEIKDEYILYVSRFEKRKKQLELIKEWEVSNSALKLILIGFEVDGSKKICEDYCSKKGLNNVIFLQNLSLEDLKDYYINSSKIFYLSQSEGFGLPVIEALYLNGNCYFYNKTALQEFSFASQNFIDERGIKFIIENSNEKLNEAINYREIIKKYYNLDSNLKNYIANI